MIPGLEWSLWIFDIAYYVLLVICFKHALKQAPYLAVGLIVGIIFGYSIEYSAVVTVPQPYHYNFFLVTLPGPVPLGAVIGWGLIFYASTETARKLKLPWYIQPLCAGLMSAGVDFVIDPIVVYVGFWSWTEAVQWFGVPWSNYVGWVTIIGSLSFFQNLGYRWFPPGSRGLKGDILVACVAMLPAYVSVVGLIKAYLWLVSLGWFPESIWVSLVFGIGAIVVLRYLKEMDRDNKFEWQIVAVPGFFYAWSIIMLYVSGFYKENQELILIYPAFILIGLVAFCWPYFNKLLAVNNKPSE